MTIANFSSPKTATAQTVGLVTATVVSFDAAAPTLVPVPSGQLMATVLLLGREATAPDFVRAMLLRSFKYEAGVLTALDGAAIVLGTTLATGAIAGATVDLNASGTVIRGQATGVVGLTIDWTGFLWINSTSF